MFESVFLILFILILAGVFLLFILAFVQLFRPWLQCFMSGAPVPLPQILAMRLRKTPVQLICEQRIKASQVGIDLPVEDLERAYLQGADVEKIVDALCKARHNNQDFTWEELLRTELAE